MRQLRLCLVILLVGGSVALAAAVDKRAQGDAAIKQTIKSYVEAFNRGDAKALAAHWTVDGSFVTATGEEFLGRKKLENAFKTFFSRNKGIKLKVTPLAIYAESPTKAMEEGLATTTRPGEAPESTRYVAAYVKQDGAWKIARLKEVFPVGSSSHYEKLKALEWMTGDWIDEDRTGRLVTRCFWTKNRNFLVRSFSLKIGKRIAFTGKQIIGWDPSSKQIRSWVFDSNGDFGEGTWTKRGDSWYVSSTIVLNTGEKASSINVFTPVSENSFTWQSTGREVAGELLPNTPKVTVVRKQADSKQKTSSGK
jgi:uncharacterized protein (TIGR02246 family)